MSRVDGRDPLRLGTDEDRFDRLYREYAGDVYRYALAIMRNPADAEDVTQTTFLNAWRAFSAGEEPRAPQNWFISIAHNVCRLKFRTRSRRPHEVEFEPALAEAPVVDGPSASDVLDALAELPLNQRAAIVMRELEGRPYNEIASILGVSRAAVETLIFRARRSLRVRRDALRVLSVLPLPQSLAAFVRTRGAAEAGGVALLGGGVAAKVAAVIAAGVVAVGVGREAVPADATPQPEAATPARVQIVEPPTTVVAPAARPAPAAAARTKPAAVAAAAAPRRTARPAAPTAPAAPDTRPRPGGRVPDANEPAADPGTPASPPAAPPPRAPERGPVARPEPAAPVAAAAPPPAPRTKLPLPALPKVTVPVLPLEPVVPRVAVPELPALPAVPLPAVPAPVAPVVAELPVEVPQPPAALPVPILP